MSDIIDIGTLTHADADAVRARLLALSSESNKSFIEIGAWLWRVWEQQLWQQWTKGAGGKFESFKDFVDTELKFSSRKGEMLVRIWACFVVDHTKAKHPQEFERGEYNQDLMTYVQEYGVTKLYLASGYMTWDNREEWCDRLDTMSARDLEKHIKVLKTGAPAQAEGDTTKPNLETHDTKGMNFALYPAQYETVSLALKAAEKIGNTNKKGELINLICGSYLAGATGELGTGIAEAIGQLERAFGVSIMAVRFGDGAPEVVHGANVLKRLGE